MMRRVILALHVAAGTSSGVGRGILQYVRRKYYHYTLWTGIYMMDDGETRILNVLFLVVTVLVVRWVTGLVSWVLSFSW